MLSLSITVSRCYPAQSLLFYPTGRSYRVSSRSADVSVREVEVNPADSKVLRTAVESTGGQVAVQSIFALLDVLTSWSSKANSKSSKANNKKYSEKEKVDEKEKEKDKNKDKDKDKDKDNSEARINSSSFFSFFSPPQLSSLKSSRLSARREGEEEQGQEQEQEHPFKGDPCQCIIALLVAVPKELLGRAALRIKAYARALRYFELHAREVKCRLSSVSNGEAEPLFHLNSITGPGSSSSSRSLPPASNPLAVMHCSRNDGSNGELPELDEAQLDRLVEVVSHLDDPDALQGVQKLRYAIAQVSSVPACVHYLNTLSSSL